jgi:hypothetical protein
MAAAPEQSHRDPGTCIRCPPVPTHLLDDSAPAPTPNERDAAREPTVNSLPSLPLMTCSTACLRAREDWIDCLALPVCIKDSAHGCVSHCRLTPFVVFPGWRVATAPAALPCVAHYHAVLRCGVVGCQGTALFLDALIREG